MKQLYIRKDTPPGLAKLITLTNSGKTLKSILRTEPELAEHIDALNDLMFERGKEVDRQELTPSLKHTFQSIVEKD